MEMFDISLREGLEKDGLVSIWNLWEPSESIVSFDIIEAGCILLFTL